MAAQSRDGVASLQNIFIVAKLATPGCDAMNDGLLFWQVAPGLDEGVLRETERFACRVVPALGD